MNFYNNRPMMENELLFILELRIPEHSPLEYEVQEQLLAGLDPRNDMILIDPKVKAKHFLFRKNQNILTVHYTGAMGDSSLNGVPLEKDKTYILEKGDVLKAGEIEILVRHKMGTRKPIIHHPAAKSATGEASKINIKQVTKKVSKEVAKEAVKESPKHKPKKSTATTYSFSRSIALIPYKIYGFFIDIALTYLTLSFIIPKMGRLEWAQNFFYPISEFLSQYLINHHPEHLRSLPFSFIEFYIWFHLLIIPTSLILGNSPGAFLIGLHQKNKTNFLARHFKAYIYALINIVALPLIVLDIPIYKGKNAKEIFTFSERELSTSGIFKFSRKALAPLLIIASLLSPFFLKLPYNSGLSLEKSLPPKYVDSHTFHISSYSRELGISLNTELNHNFRILPYFEKKQLGLMLYDIKTKRFLLIKEQRRMANELALYKFRYSNPLASLNIASNEIDNEFLKNKTTQSLNLSLGNFAAGVRSNGPFIGNNFLFKGELLKNFFQNDNFSFNPFDAKTPIIKISSSSSSDPEEKFFLFARKEIIEFALFEAGQLNLIEHFTTSFLAALKFDQSSDFPLASGLKDPQVLEILDAFERSNYQSILTYYINEAKKAKETKETKDTKLAPDSDWLALLRANIMQTKRVLFEDPTRAGLNKNIEKSFEDIVKTI